MLEEEEEAAGSPRDRPRFRPRFEDKVLRSLSLYLSFFLASRWTLYARRVSCQRSRLRHLCRPSLSLFLSSYPSCHLSPLSTLFHPSFTTVTFYFCFFSYPLLLSTRFSVPFFLSQLSLFPPFRLSLTLSFSTRFVTSIILSRASRNLHLGKVFKRRPTYVKFVFEGSSLRLSYMFSSLPHFSFRFTLCLLFHLYWFSNWLRLVCTVYLLNILLVLFRRSLSQINKRISLLSFFCLSLSFSLFSSL